MGSLLLVTQATNRSAGENTKKLSSKGRKENSEKCHRLEKGPGFDQQNNFQGFPQGAVSCLRDM